MTTRGRQTSRQKEALDNAEQSLQERNRADAKTKEARRHLYDAHMNLAQTAWNEAQVGQTVRLLDLYRLAAGQNEDPDDLRGFEWYYWDRLCHSELGTLKGHTSRVDSVAFSPDGKRIVSVGSDGRVKIWDTRPLTPELRAECEALSLIHILSDQGKAQAEWLDAIEADQTISEPVRQRALQFAREWK